MVVKSASTGSSPPYGLWGLRPISKVPTKERTVFLPRISVAPSLLLWGGLTGLTGTGTTLLDYATKIEWFGTARVRAGYLFGDGAVLSYVTAGLAYGRVGLSGTSTVSGTVDTVPFSITHAIGHSNVNTGWVVGSGTEGKLANFPGWTYRIEGLYMDLGHLDDTDVALPTIKSVTGGQTFTHTHFTDTILRLGVNYQFH